MTASASTQPVFCKTTQDTEPVINDVVIQVATSNGTGSQSANLVLLRTIFQMGVPVGGKNMFPSNIQGLPTWFTIRANAQGWTARRRDADLFVAMNVESVEEDIAALRPGATLVLHADLEKHLTRDDLNVHVVPFGRLVAEVCPDARLRRLVVNMIYVGVVAWLLELDMDEVGRAIAKQFSGKPKAADLNLAAARAGHAWAEANLPPHRPFVIRRMDRTAGKIIMDGNTAMALGLMYGGLTVFAWYPITPSSSLAEALTDFMAKYRHDAETGKATYAIVQAEDELAAIGIVTGAGWAGARAATATSGPGISLMAEIVGLAHFAEIPAVVIDVQRVGPSTGLPTRTSQGDMMSAYYLSHGDTRHPLLIPATLAECYEFAMQALDLAERLQTPVFIMSDLDLGMNLWMSEPFAPPTRPMDRGKVLTAQDLERLGGFARYRDVDGDGIGWRTLPGTRHPKAAYFTQGAGHDDAAKRSEKPADWQNNLDRLRRKIDGARNNLPQPAIQTMDNPRAALIGYGTSDEAIAEARHILATQHATPTDYLRLRALPPADSVREFIAAHPRVFVVEQNRDAQVAAILQAEYPDLAPRIGGIVHYNGLPLDALTVVEGVLSKGSDAP